MHTPTDRHTNMFNGDIDISNIHNNNNNITTNHINTLQNISTHVHGTSR